MAKRGKSATQDIGENTDENGVTMIPMGRRTVVTRDEMPLPENEDQFAGDESEADDPFEDVLAEIDESQAAYHVYKDQVGNPKPMFCRVYKLPITYGELLMNIQQEFKGGNYTLYLHRGFGRGGMLRTVKTTIAEPIVKKDQTGENLPQNEMLMYLRNQAEQAEKRTHELMMAIMQKPAAAPVPDPMESLAKALALIHKATPQQTQGNGTFAQMLQMLDLQDRLKERLPSEREPGGSDFLMKMVEMLGPAIAQAMQQRGGQRAIAPPAQAANGRPGAQSAPVAASRAPGAPVVPPGVIPPAPVVPPGVVIDPQSAPMLPLGAEVLAPYISIVVGAAERNADPEETADAVLDLLPVNIYNQIVFLAPNDALYMQLMANPVFANYRDWCDKFRAAVIDLTAEDRNVSGGNTGGSVQTPGENRNAT